MSRSLIHQAAVDMEIGGYYCTLGVTYAYDPYTGQQVDRLTRRAVATPATRCQTAYGG